MIFYAKVPVVENSVKIFIKNLTKFQQSGTFYLDYEDFIVCLLSVTDVVPERYPACDAEETRSLAQEACGESDWKNVL